MSAIDKYVDMNVRIVELNVRRTLNISISDIIYTYLIYITLICTAYNIYNIHELALKMKKRI